MLKIMLQKYKRISLKRHFLSDFDTLSKPKPSLREFGTLLAYGKQSKDIKPKTKYAMNIKPLADRVLIKPAPAEEKTVGGIIIPDTAKEKPLQGEVLAVGGGTKDEEMVLKAGDRVLYGKYSGTEVELEGEKYLIMRQSDVLAII